MKNPVVIIGSGPAGIACALQLKRHCIHPIVFERNEVGGLLRNANFVENYPGFPEGLTGRAFVEKLKNHLNTYKIFPVFEEVTQVGFDNGFYEIKTSQGLYMSRFLVVATGTVPKKLNIEANNVFYEVCELYKQDLTDKKIVVIGSGDAAFDYALNLADNSRASEIKILNRDTKTRCLPLLKQQTLENPRIKYIENKELDESIEYDYILAAIGREPNTKFLSCHPEALAEGSISKKKLQDSSGINPLRMTQRQIFKNDVFTPYYIGDVNNGNFRQTAIAAGDGIRAAMEINQIINLC